MSVQYPFGFEIGNNEPIDSRFVFLDLAARNNLLSINRYEGLKTYVQSEGAFFSLVGGIDNTNWVQDGSGGGSSEGESIYATIDNDIATPTALISEVFTNAFYAGITFDYQIVREASDLGRKVVKGSFGRVYNAAGTDTFKSGDKIGDKVDIGFTLELNPVSGLLEYTSTDFTGTGYQGFIKLYNFQRLSLVSGGDGTFQSAPIDNGVLTPTPVISNLFPSTTHVGVIFTAFIHREVDGIEYNSYITRSVVYTSAGTKEDGTRLGDNSGVVFTLDQASGELRYTSTDMPESASEYLGFINFYELIPLKLSAGPTASSSVSLPSSLTGQVELSDIYTDPDNDGFETMLMADARKVLRVDTSINGAFQLDISAFMNLRGNIVTVMDLGGALADEPLTVTFGGGATVMGGASITLNTPNISYRFVYMDDLADWRVMEGTGLGVNILNGVPTGAIIPFAGITPPNLYALANGAEVLRASPTYAALFAIIGTAWGEGDGTTTFRLPKLNGRTLRFIDDGEGVDPDAALRTALFAGGNTGDAVGSYQEDEHKLHNHNGASTFDKTALNLVVPTATSTTVKTLMQSDAWTGGASVPITTQNSGGNESRMKNAYTYALIKL